MLPLAFFSAWLLILAGCMSISSQTQPVNVAVQSLVSGEDCTPIILGMGFGTNTVEQAMSNGAQEITEPQKYGIKPVTQRIAKPIVRLHSVAIAESYFVGFGSRCVVVVGEPERLAVK